MQKVRVAAGEQFEPALQANLRRGVGFQASEQAQARHLLFRAQRLPALAICLALSPNAAAAKKVAPAVDALLAAVALYAEAHHTRDSTSPPTHPDEAASAEVGRSIDSSVGSSHAEVSGDEGDEGDVEAEAPGWRLLVLGTHSAHECGANSALPCALITRLMRVPVRGACQGGFGISVEAVEILIRLTRAEGASGGRPCRRGRGSGGGGARAGAPSLAQTRSLNCTRGSRIYIPELQATLAFALVDATVAYQGAAC
jgi:hypothetical protein